MCRSALLFKGVKYFSPQRGKTFVAVEDLFSPKVAIPSWATPETISQDLSSAENFSKNR